MFFGQIVRDVTECGSTSRNWIGIDSHVCSLSDAHMHAATTEGLLLILTHIQTVLKRSSAAWCHAAKPSDSQLLEALSGGGHAWCLHEALLRALSHVRWFAVEQYNRLTALGMSPPTTDGPAWACDGEARLIRRTLLSIPLTAEHRVQAVVGAADLLVMSVRVRGLSDHVEETEADQEPGKALSALGTAVGWFSSLTEVQPAALGMVPKNSVDRMEHLCTIVRRGSAAELCGFRGSADAQPAAFIHPRAVVIIGAAETIIKSFRHTVEGTVADVHAMEQLHCLAMMLGQEPTEYDDVAVDALLRSATTYVVPERERIAWPSTVQHCRSIGRFLLDNLPSETLSSAGLRAVRIATESIDVVLRFPDPRLDTLATAYRSAKDGNLSAMSLEAVIRWWALEPSPESTSYSHDAEVCFATLLNAHQDHQVRARIAGLADTVTRLSVGGASAAAMSAYGEALLPGVSQHARQAIGAVMPELLMLCLRGRR